MSTFGGKIQEIPYISVDRFDGDNLNSEVYFLSHCHTDHMVGLCQTNFIDNLRNNEKYIYASDISSVIVKTLYPDLENCIRVLDIYKPTIITIKSGNLTVLPIPAGHCPGSVMFLFETNNNVRILYTGDYRINKSDIRKLKSFYDPFKQVKDIDKIYLDTTFFLKRYNQFPKRQESLKELCNLIKEWTSKGENYNIELVICAKYGYEYVFNEIYNKIGMPVHVCKAAYDFYSIIPEMDKSVTLNKDATQIHCFYSWSYPNLYDRMLHSNTRVIKMSALMWTQNNLENGISDSCYNMYYVCYSTHASYEEGVELLKFLKPKSVEVCVEYNDPEKNSEMLMLINEVLEEYRPKAEKEFKHKLFDTVENVPEGTVSVVEEETTFDLSILDSPPRTPKRLTKKLKVEANMTFSATEELMSISESSSSTFHSVEVQSTHLC